MELLEEHIKTLFVLDSQSKMVSINEPWDKTKPAPRLYIGKTIDGTIIYKSGYDVSSIKIKEIEKILFRESMNNKFEYLEEYLEIMESKNYVEEICYYYNNIKEDTINNCEIICKKIHKDNITDFTIGEFEWLKDEINYCQPCYGIINNGNIISVCRSVRITEKAHQAGIETVKEYKGKGFAGKVLKKWANDILNKSCIPFYSTLKENKASQRVAEKMELKIFGIGISVK